MTDIQHSYEMAAPYKVGESIDFESFSEAELKNLIDQASSRLKALENVRIEKALSDIRAIAKQHGLNVSVDRRPRKPRRRKSRPQNPAQ